MNAPTGIATRPPTRDVTSFNTWEGRAFGAIVLAAFVLYGVGSAMADRSVGLTLVVVNSLAVAGAGMIGFRLLRSTDPRVASAYVSARVAEGVLLAGGILVARTAESSDVDTTGYLLAMVALAVGSVPFCAALGRRGWIPQRLAMWGMFGYAALAVGAVVELATGWPVAVVGAVPGGLFELALGLYLLRRGFRRGEVREHIGSSFASIGGGS